MGAGGGGPWPPLEHTGFTPISNSCYKKPHLFIVCPPPSMNFCMQPCLWMFVYDKFSLTGPASKAQPSPNPVIQRPTIRIILKATAFLMYHDTPSIVQPTKYETAVSITVSLRPNVSAKKPARVPPNNDPTGPMACIHEKNHKNKLTTRCYTHSKDIL